MMHTLWISWENHRRNQEISRNLNIPLLQLDEVANIDNPIKKYFVGLLKTIVFLLTHKPKLIVCQNPSIVLSFFAVLNRFFFRRKVVIDAHNAGLFPLEGKSCALMRISKVIQLFSNLTIVTNEALKKEVEHNGGTGYVLPDPIPQLPNAPNVELPNCFNILFICTFAVDEPYINVIEAAQLLDDTYHIHITGNYFKSELRPNHMPSNVTLLGYVSEHYYISLLNAVDATIDLTDRENCLVCGAYESVSAEKPMIISGSKALKAYFSKGAVYTNNSVNDLVSVIQTLRRDYDRLKTEVQLLKTEKIRLWDIARDGLTKEFARLLSE